MGAPWDKYKKTAAGPWEKYSKPEPADTTSTAQTALEHFGNGASLGYLPQLQAAAEPYIYKGLNAITGQDVQPDEYGDARDANIKRLEKESSEHPIVAGASKIAGNIATGIGSSAFLPAAAATRGGRIIQAARIGAGLGAIENPGDTQGEIDPLQLPERVMNAGKGAAFGGATGGALEAIPPALRGAGNIMKVTPKQNAPEIEAAMGRLGGKATPGMLANDEYIQNMESSLHQAPTIGGYLTRRTTGPVGKQMSAAAGDLLNESSSLSPYESGQLAKKQIGDTVNSKFQPARDTFNDLSQYTKDINAPESSRKAVTRNIMNIPDVATFEDGPAASVARSVSKALENDPSADQIKTLKTMVGKKAAALSSRQEDASGMWDIYSKLSRLEENTIKRGVIDSARTPGEGSTIAQGMLGQLKGAKQQWRSGLDSLNQYSDAAGLGNIKTPEAFTGKINGLTSEDLQGRLFNPADTEMTNSLKSTFPEAYSTLKGARLGDIAKRATVDNEVVPSKLLQATKNFSPEANNNLFGEGAQKLSDLRTADQALPDMVGPSGTPKGLEYLGALNPLNQLRDVARYGAYKGITSPRAQAISKMLSQSPQMADLAQRNPEAYHAMVLNFAGKMGGEASQVGALPAAAKQGGDTTHDTAHYDPGEHKTLPDDVAKNRFLEGN